ncbi:hypothetical protein P7K49_018743 [Saguinus oedipus]|uniref:PLD phosphodiesterase domain-containing protein n=1 Tax=Saguinus oedipus TaxID=9490 RepID=A0ABQ9V901_SAGOE|nr:hypothetical protein P7K49_018743 [Saguinus oedipus]
MVPAQLGSPWKRTLGSRGTPAGPAICSRQPLCPASGPGLAAATGHCPGECPRGLILLVPHRARHRGQRLIFPAGAPRLAPRNLVLATQQGEALLQKLQQLLGRNISLAVATSSPTLARNSTDLQVLASQGAQVRQVPMGRLTRGVLHSKFWVVDGRHIYMGSANMDWRSLTQVKELGAVIYNCSHLAQDLEKTFQTYWVLGAPEAVLPKTWPQNFSSDINRFQPFRGLFDGVPTTAYFSVRQIEKKPIRTLCSSLTGQPHREPSGLALQTPAASAGSSGSQHSGWGCGPGVSSSWYQQALGCAWRQA